MQEIIIIAGPNGAGKTSFANEYLPPRAEGLEFVNADEIARYFSGTDLTKASLDLAAARRMLATIDQLSAERTEFMFETTLASLAYSIRIPKWQQCGYHVSLIYLRLPNVEASIARVRKRVSAGGHSIPDDVIRRRFTRSLEYLETIYKPIVDDWSVWDSLEGDFVVAETSDNIS